MTNHKLMGKFFASYAKNILQYFDNYPGEEPVNRKYDSRNQLIGVYVGELEEEMIGERKYINTFYINFPVIEEGESFREKLFMDDVIAVCQPRTYSDYVKCFGFKHGTGVWEDNAEVLVKEGSNRASRYAGLVHRIL